MSDVEERKRAYRLAPCPAYDIEGTESWLEDMAEKGLVLSGDGFFAGVACFWKTEPRQLRYRLEAAPEGTGLWSGNGGLPAEEAVEINEAYGWKYVANRGQFHIYCTDDPSAREMHTDPDVQALALNIANKRARANMITALIYFMIFPLIHLRGGVLLTAVHMGSGLMLGGLLLVLIALGRTVARVLHLRRLRKRLSAGEAPHRKNWRRRALYHRLSRPIFIGLTIIWLGFFFQGWSNENLGGNIMPLEEFTGQIPFATLADMVPAGEYRFNNYLDTNTIKTDSDWLAPVMITLHENATITLDNGKQFEGGLIVDYYETVSPFIAGRLAREHVLRSKWNKRNSRLDITAPGLDYAFAYKEIFPTIVLQQGSKVARITFYQLGDYSLSLDELAEAFAASLKGQSQ